MARANTSKASRHANDFYPTPPFFTELLPEKVPIAGSMGEPFAGDCAIAKVFSHYEPCTSIWTNDLVKYPGGWYDSLLDLSIKDNWDDVPVVDWMVTNPAYTLMNDAWYLNAIYERCRKGLAMLLRQTWVGAGAGDSGTNARGLWLEEHPITKLIVLPRYAWTDNSTTGKPQVDACAHYWVVWDKTGWKPSVPIEVVTGRSIPGWQQRKSDAGKLIVPASIGQYEFSL